MYGVPADLDLGQFRGDYLTQLCLGPWDVQFKFGAGGCISVQSRWELRGQNGELLDEAAWPTAERGRFRLHALVGATVTDGRVDPPRSFTLAFDTGLSLTVYDDDPHYESFSIQPGNIFV